MAGPGAAARAGPAYPAGGATTCTCRAIAGVIPAVAVVGGSGDRPTTGRASRNAAGSAGRARPRIGRDVAIAAAGTTTAACAFRKLLIVTLFTLVMFVTFVTWRKFTPRT